MKLFIITVLQHQLSIRDLLKDLLFLLSLEYKTVYIHIDTDTYVSVHLQIYIYRKMIRFVPFAAFFLFLIFIGYFVSPALW